MKKTCLAMLLLFWSAPAFAACPKGQTPMLNVRIYVGLAEQDGTPVPESAWADFLATTVTPRFPQGFTVYDAMGQWRDVRTRVIGRERSRIIEIDRPDTREFRASVEDVRKAYGKRFHQQAVGIVTMPACAAF